MDILSIEILNPKAKRLLEDMADLDLIAIRENSIQIDPMSWEEKVQLMKQAANDPLYLADMKEIADDFEPIDHETL